MSTIAIPNNVTTVGHPEGPVIVCAHGFGYDQNMWRRIVDSFAMGREHPPALQGEMTAGCCRTRPDIAHDCAGLTFHSDARGMLAEVSTPTLVLQCTNDSLAPVGVAEYVHSRLQSSTFLLLQAAGHCPQVSAPEKTTAAILDFFADE